MINYSLATSVGTRKSAQLPTESPKSILEFLRRLRTMQTPKQIGSILHQHEESIYLKIAAGMPATKVGRRWKIDPILLASWLEAQGYVSSVPAKASAATNLP